MPALLIQFLKKIIYYCSLFYRYFISAICYLIPIKKNKFFFESHRGTSFSCNPKYIFLELVKTQLASEIVWSLPSSSLLPKGANVKTCQRKTIKYFYHLYTSQFLIQNGEFAHPFLKKKKSYHINTQHGVPLKKMGASIEFNQCKDAATRKWDIFIAASDYTSKIFQKDFDLSLCKTFVFGQPRNDILIFPSEVKINELKNKYNIPHDHQVIFYCPTYRDYNSKINFRKIFQYAINQTSKTQKITFLYRDHHLTNNINPHKFSFTDVSSPEHDIQELLLITDMLMTDFSSCFFDFLYLKRPILFYCPDFDLYDDFRGLYFNLKKIMGDDLVYNKENLHRYFENISQYFLRTQSKLEELTNLTLLPIPKELSAQKVIEEVIKNVER